MLKLYFSPGSCSLSPHIVLREAGVPFELIRVHLGTHKLQDGTDYYSINPRGQVPALRLDSGELLTEGAVIVQYIADQAPSSTVIPKAGTMDRYRAQEWLNFVASEMHKGIGALFNRQFNDDARVTLKNSMTPKFEFLERHLADRQFLLGGEFCAADAYLFTVLGWTNYVGIDLSPYKAIGEFLARVKARPAVRAALDAEKEASA